MRVTIDKGYRRAVEQLMSELQTEDPKLAIQHIIGCWLSGGCSGQSTPKDSALTDEFSDAVEW
jgi:hypothetical protein